MNRQHVAARNLPRCRRAFTSFDAFDFIGYMDTIGWPNDGALSELLSSVGYDFDQARVRLVETKYDARAHEALTLLIFEL